MRHILRCVGCGSYTMSETCPVCGRPAQTTRPPKYSTDDKYAALRRKAKEMQK